MGGLRSGAILRRSKCLGLKVTVKVILKRITRGGSWRHLEKVIIRILWDAILRRSGKMLAMSPYWGGRSKLKHCFLLVKRKVG